MTKTEALKLLHAVRSERCVEMTRLRAFVRGTQYEGRPGWFTDTKPLFERAPCIVYPIAKGAIDSNADYVLGEGRFPVLSSRSSWSPAADDETTKAADGFAQAVASQARLAVTAREIFADAQTVGSAAAIVGTRAGRLFVDTTDAEWCTPTVDRDGVCLSLEIQYPYLATVRTGSKIEYVARMFRRVIDAERDVTFLPADIRTETQSFDWKIDPAATVAHGLGFCPVVWYPHLRGCSIVGHFDGRPIHDQLLDEIEALDFALSMRHQAALYAGSPQWTEIGVKPGYNPAPGRLPQVLQQSSVAGGATSESNPPHKGGYVDGARPGGGARRKGPGVVWQYEGENVKVALHSLPEGALKAIDEHARDLRTKLSEALGIVLVDPESLPRGGLSGKALGALRDRQIQRCSQYRSDFGDRCLLPLWAMLMRVALLKRIPFQGASAVTSIQRSAETFWSWHAPPFELAWGAFEPPDPEEQMQKLTAAKTALEAKIATKKQAVFMVRDVLGVEDVNAYMVELDAEYEGEEPEENETPAEQKIEDEENESVRDLQQAIE